MNQINSKRCFLLLFIFTLSLQFSGLLIAQESSPQELREIFEAIDDENYTERKKVSRQIVERAGYHLRNDTPTLGAIINPDAEFKDFRLGNQFLKILLDNPYKATASTYLAAFQLSGHRMTELTYSDKAQQRLIDLFSNEYEQGAIGNIHRVYAGSLILQLQRNSNNTLLMNTSDLLIKNFAEDINFIDAFVAIIGLSNHKASHTFPYTFGTCYAGHTRLVSIAYQVTKALAEFDERYQKYVEDFDKEVALFESDLGFNNDAMARFKFDVKLKNQDINNNTAWDIMDVAETKEKDEALKYLKLIIDNAERINDGIVMDALLKIHSFGEASIIPENVQLMLVSSFLDGIDSSQRKIKLGARLFAGVLIFQFAENKQNKKLRQSIDGIVEKMAAQDDLLKEIGISWQGKRLYDVALHFSDNPELVPYFELLVRIAQDIASTHQMLQDSERRELWTKLFEQMPSWPNREFPEYLLLELKSYRSEKLKSLKNTSISSAGSLGFCINLF
ncbi:MAG: hypothetical protein ABIA04_03885 [Pseudomonadota bacterium]